MIAGFSIAPAVAIHGAEAAKRLIDRMVRRGPAYPVTCRAGAIRLLGRSTLASINLA